MTDSIHLKKSSVNTLRNVAILLAPMVFVIVMMNLLPLDDFWRGLPFMKWQAKGIFQFLFVLSMYPVAWAIGKAVHNGDYLEEIQLVYGILFAESLVLCLLTVSTQLIWAK